jgi:hypothetical protein
MATFRESAWNLSPGRLRTSTAARLVYALYGLPLDIVAGMADQAAKSGFPTLAPEDALPFIGRDRGIVRGPQEPSESYRARQLLWIQAWEDAGVGRAMLDQIAGYLTPMAVRLRIWTQVGIVYTRELDGELTIDRVAGDLWNWDGQSSLWSRFWVVIYSLDGSPWTRMPRYGASSGTWGSRPGLTWGSSATVSEARSIRGIIDEFKPALSKCQNVIISFDADAFAPTDAAPPLPAGTWGEYWDTSSLSANRDRRALYWKGV